MSDLLTIQQTADLLQVKTSWLYNQTAKRAIPYIKIGGHLRFKRTDIEALIAANRVEADGPQPVAATRGR